MRTENLLYTLAQAFHVKEATDAVKPHPVKLDEETLKALVKKLPSPDRKPEQNYFSDKVLPPLIGVTAGTTLPPLLKALGQALVRRRTPPAPTGLRRWFGKKHSSETGHLTVREALTYREPVRDKPQRVEQCAAELPNENHFNKNYQDANPTPSLLGGYEGVLTGETNAQG